MTSPIEILRWDSRFFGRRTARIKSATLTPQRAQAAINACLEQRVRCLYFLASSEDAAAMTCAEAAYFHLMDIRVTLDRDTTPLRVTRPADLPAAATYRSARLADIPLLQRMSLTMFPNSRFAVDPGFPPGASQKLFSTWIAKSVRGHFDDWMGVALWRERLVGFVSCRRVGRTHGVIGLLGVASAFRRRGIGRGLLQQGLAWFRAHHVRQISVATQGRAIGAQRLYQNCGFRTRRIDLWYHKWF